MKNMTYICLYKTLPCLRIGTHETVFAHMIRNRMLPLSHIMRPSWLCHVWKCTILNLNIFNSLLEKIMKISNFENIHRDESNNILYAIFCLYISIKIWSKHVMWTIHIFKLCHLKWDVGITFKLNKSFKEKST